MPPRTRQEAVTHLSNLVGTGQELLSSGLPTLRDVLRCGILLREISINDARNYPNSALVSDVYLKVVDKWKLVSHGFVFPVINNEVTVKKKIKNLWEKFSKYSLGFGVHQSKAKDMIKLDKLFDILNCKCDIKSCFENGCDTQKNCKLKVHISCKCQKSMKIPKNELSFIRSEREKIGSKGQYQIGLVDHPESVKMTKKQNRRETEKKRQSELVQNDGEDALLDDIEYSFESESKNEDIEKKKTRSRQNLENVATQSIRYGVSLRATAAIATAAYIDAGLISKEDQTMIVDHHKVKRAREKVMRKLNDEFSEFVLENQIQCIFFDGRIDKTKVMLKSDDSDKNFPAVVKEEHYSMCIEPGGKYLYHFSPIKTGNELPAETIANEMIRFMTENQIDKTLLAIGGDSTNTNTGWKGGIMKWIEVKLGRRLIWLICMLHTNELPLRHLMASLDGPTLSNNKWTGEIGKLLDSATELEINQSFKPISIGDPLIPLEDSVVDDLSSDQAYGYRIVSAIRSGKISTELSLLEIGPVCHARWLTTANRLCRLWVSRHGLKGKNLKHLRMIVEYIIGVYYPLWFMIKVKYCWVEGPRHIIYQLKLLKLQKKEVQDIVRPTIQRSAYYSFSEMIIQTLLCSNDSSERNLAVNKIIQLRSENNSCSGDTSLRDRKTPKINFDADNILELISWDESIYEPVLTINLTIDEIRKFIEVPMDVPKWPCHTQSAERVVKQVTEAASSVYSFEKREGFIRAREASRAIMAQNDTKKDLLSLVT